MTVVLTSRDRAMIHAAASLGYTTNDVLRSLVSPHLGPNTLRRRLRQLQRAGYLVQLRVVGPTGHTYLYGVGRRALPRGSSTPWRPGLAQYEHTLAVGDALVAVLRPGFAAPAFQIVEWQGEAEIRGWLETGAPRPDLRLRWQSREADGWWNVEVDRGTEYRRAWRRKLGRYLEQMYGDPVLTITTTPGRARSLARLAADMGAVMWATTAEAVRVQADPWVLDAAHRSRWSLTAAATAHLDELAAERQRA